MLCPWFLGHNWGLATYKPIKGSPENGETLTVSPTLAIEFSAFSLMAINFNVKQ